MPFPLSVFCGASTAIALLVSGCGEDKTPRSGALPDGGSNADLVSVPQPDGGMTDVPSVPQPDGGVTDVLAVPQPDGGVVSVPSMCQVPTAVAAPYTVKFRFRNRASTPVFRYLGCTSEVEIASCASSYSDQLASRVGCPCDCASGFCPTCGACYDEGMPLASDGIFEETWDGRVPVPGTGAGGRACNDWKAVPAGRYRVRLPVYASAADAKAHAPPVAVATADFDLPVPAAGSVIEIDITP